MTSTFFSEPFAHLHDDVFAFLAASPTIHAALSLLGVNRYWRKLTIRKLVKEFSSTKLWELYFDPDTGDPLPIYSPGGYLKIYPCCICWGDGARETDDPRYAMSPEYEQRLSEPQTMNLLLTHFDPSTTMCTFKPAQMELKIIDYEIVCNEQGEEYCDLPRSFNIASSAWFRCAEQKGGGLYGLELAGRPERFPLRGAPGFFPKVVEPKDIEAGRTRTVANDQTLGHGRGVGANWTASWHTIRTSTLSDELPRFSTYTRDVAVMLVVHEIQLPLIDLFCPRERGAEKQYYDD